MAKRTKKAQKQSKKAPIASTEMKSKANVLKGKVAKADGYMKAGMSRVKAIHKAGLWYRQYLSAKKIKDLSKVKVGRRAA